MCGICGSLRLGHAEDQRDLVQRMIATIRHRGPDDCGMYSDSHVTLGHTRLSIIDIAGGRQPMHNEDQSLWVTFNGEIFNYVELRDELIGKGHRFSTTSDTEVILHLYEEEGERCVERFNGQWAFALWDARERKLFLSRDRLGVRPLYYTETPGGFFFASEMKALFQCPEVPRELDLESLNQIFTFWSVLPPRTPFRNIRQLPPGHSMAVKDGHTRIWAYWSLSFPPPGDVPAYDEQRLTEELEELLLDATRIRLRSDVPVGAYLSGGLDSTFVTALLRKLAGGGLRSFSVAFDDSEFDESKYQREASSFLGTEHEEVRCTREDIARVFPEVIRHTEQPILRTAPAPLFLLSKRVRDSGFKVVLTGEGADETLGGYDIYKEVKIRSFLKRQPGSSRRLLLLKRLYPYMNGLQRQPAAYLRSFFHADEDSGGPFFSHLPRWQLTAKAKAFFSPAVTSELRGHDPIDELRNSLPSEYFAWDAFLQAQYLETKCLLPNYILSSQGDRVALAHSIEGRFPFLDHRVVQFAARLPVRLKMKVLNEKYLLKRCAKGWIPPSILGRSKQPYRAPDSRCFTTTAARDYVDDLLSPGGVRHYGVFDPNSVAMLADKLRSGRVVGEKDNMAVAGVLSTQLLMAHLSRSFDKELPTHAG